MVKALDAQKFSITSSFVDRRGLQSLRVPDDSNLVQHQRMAHNRVSDKALNYPPSIRIPQVLPLGGGLHPRRWPRQLRCDLPPRPPLQPSHPQPDPVGNAAWGLGYHCALVISSGRNSQLLGPQ